MTNVSIKKNAILNVFRTLMGFIFPLITFPYVSRILGPIGTGKIHYAQSIVSYFSMLAMLGINTYGLREAAKIRDDKDKLSKFYKEIMTINLISTFVSYVLFFIALFLFKSLINYRNILLVTSGSILFTTLGVEWLYGAEEDYTYITIRSVIFQLIGLVLLFIFVKSEDDYLQYASLSVITNVGSNLLNFLHCKKYVFITKKYQLEIKKHIKPIFILFGKVVAICIYTVLDTTMLGALCGDEQVGLYNAATRINKIVISLIVSVGVVLTPRMSNIVDSDKDTYKKLLKKTCDLYIFLTIPCTAGLFFLAKPIILLFCGVNFSDAIVTMQIMTFIIIFISFGHFFADQFFTPMRKDTYSLYSTLAGAIINFVLNCILIPRLYSLGAGIATVVAEFTVCLTRFFLSNKLLKITNLFKNIYQNIIAVIIMIVIIYGIKIIKLSTIPYILISVSLGAISYCMVLLIFKNQFLLEISSIIKNRIFTKETKK